MAMVVMGGAGVGIFPSTAVGFDGKLADKVVDIYSKVQTRFNRPLHRSMRVKRGSLDHQLMMQLGTARLLDTYPISRRFAYFRTNDEGMRDYGTIADYRRYMG